MKAYIYIFRVPYHAASLQCRLKKLPPGVIPEAVSIVTKSCDQPNNLLRIHNNKMMFPQSSPPLFNYTVCLGGPLKFGLNNTNQLTEWLEMNAMFGADHFVLYNHSASSQLTSYIDYYLKDRKLIEWLPWQLPESIDNPKTMKNFGHAGLVNDCLYRSMYRSKRVVYMDTDEFIVPRHNDVTTWDGLLAKTGCESASFISVKNVFFKKEWPDDDVAKENHRIIQLDLVTQLKTKREEKIWGHGVRSKYMIIPEHVDYVGIHRIWKLIPQGNTKSCKLDAEMALVHHYRWWKGPTPNWVEDNLMHRHRVPLVRRVEHVHKQVALLVSS